MKISDCNRLLQYNIEDGDFIVSGNNIMFLAEGLLYVLVTLCDNYSW